MEVEGQSRHPKAESPGHWAVPRPAVGPAGLRAAPPSQRPPSCLCPRGTGPRRPRAEKVLVPLKKHTSCDSTCFCHIGFCHFQSESHFDDTTLRCWQRDSASAASGFSTSVSKLYWPERCRCRKANWLKKFMATESALASMDKNFRISCSGKSQDQCGASRPSETH